MTDEPGSVYWKNGVLKHSTRPYVPFSAENKRTYVKSRQCAAQYTRGTKAGTQCKGYALADSLYCKKHHRTGDPNFRDNAAEPHANWWVRMKQLEAETPGFLRQFMQGSGGTAAAYRERIRMQREKGFANPSVLRPLSELVGTTDPQLLKAHSKLIRMKGDLPIVNKPVAEMEPHEILVHNLRLSLDRTTELLKLPIQKEIPQADGTIAVEIDYKAAAIVKDTALRVGAMQIKVDKNALAAQRLDKMAELLERLKRPDELPAPVEVISS